MKKEVFSLALLVGFALLLAFSIQGSLAKGDGSPSPSVEGKWKNTVGAKKCLECHERAFEAWTKTSHFKRKSLNGKKVGKILSNLGGEGDITRRDDCIQCHFAIQKEGDKRVVMSGVSCESCHGAAKKWYKKHETQEDRKKAIHHGMLPPDNIVAIAQNCYGCHTVPNERLVNIGGHPAGSEGFNLVSWSQGEVRHNVTTDWKNKKKYQDVVKKREGIKSDQMANREASLERRRMLYLTGLLVDLKQSLDNYIRAKKKKGRFAKAMVKRVKKIFPRAKRLASSLPEMKKITTALEGAEKVENYQRGIKAVEEVLKVISQKYSGKDLTAVDHFLPSSKKYKGKVLNDFKTAPSHYKKWGKYRVPRVKKKLGNLPIDPLKK